MAYVNLINEVLTNQGLDAGENEIFMRFRDFAAKRASVANGWDYTSTGIGWTIVDESYAVDSDNAAVNDWFVLHSTGETGRDKMFFKCLLVANYMQVAICQYWDAVNHVAVGATGSKNAWYIDKPVSLYVYGDLSWVAPIAAGVASTTNWSHGNFGCLDDSWLMPLEGMGFPRNVQVCASSLTAGSDVSIVVPNSSSKLWQPGCHLMIMDDQYMERILVKTNNGSTTLTADLVNSYAAGSRIAVVFPYYVPQYYSYNWPGRPGYSTTLHDMNGTLVPSNMSHADALTTGTFNQLYAGVGSDYYVPVPLFVIKNVAGEAPIGAVPHCLKCCVSTGLTHEDLLDDLLDPAVKWRYCATTTARFYKEI
jgi:hypothetical protein